MIVFFLFSWTYLIARLEDCVTGSPHNQAFGSTSEVDKHHKRVFAPWAGWVGNKILNHCIALFDLKDYRVRGKILRSLAYIDALNNPLDGSGDLRTLLRFLRSLRSNFVTLSSALMSTLRPRSA